MKLPLVLLALVARTAGQSTSDAAAVEERVREILEDRHWG